MNSFSSVCVQIIWLLHLIILYIHEASSFQPFSFIFPSPSCSSSSYPSPSPPPPPLPLPPSIPNTNPLLWFSSCSFSALSSPPLYRCPPSPLSFYFICTYSSLFTLFSLLFLVFSLFTSSSLFSLFLLLFLVFSLPPFLSFLTIPSLLHSRWKLTRPPPQQ